jgi:hypothetical protein
VMDSIATLNLRTATDGQIVTRPHQVTVTTSTMGATSLPCRGDQLGHETA